MEAQILPEHELGIFRWTLQNWLERKGDIATQKLERIALNQIEGKNDYCYEGTEPISDGKM